MRQKDASDLRPFNLACAWPAVIPGVKTWDIATECGPPLYGEDNLPDPWSNYQIRRLQQGFSPVLVADKDYWDINKYSDTNGDWPVATASYGYSQGVTRTLEIYNDTFSGTQVDVSWEVRVDSPTGALSSSGELHPHVPLGFHSEQAILFTTPSYGSRFYLILSAAKKGVTLFRDSSEYFLLTAHPTGAISVDDSVKGTYAGEFKYQGSGWTHGTYCDVDRVSLFDGSISLDTTADDTAAVSYDGIQFTLFGATGPWYGVGAVSVDGGPGTLVDFYSPAQVADQPMWSSGPLAAGNHTVSLRVTGMKNAKSTGYAVAVDRMDIVPAPPMPTTPSPSTPMPKPLAPTGTRVATCMRTVTPTAGPVIHTVLPTATATTRATGAAALALTVVVKPTSLFTKDRLMIGVHTAPHARVRATIQVVMKKRIFMRAWGRRRRATRSIAVYQIVRQGTADGRGRFSRGVRITYKPIRPVLGHVTVTVHAGTASTMRRAQFVIWPRLRHGAARHAVCPCWKRCAAPRPC
jgi:hypothetical protein